MTVSKSCMPSSRPSRIASSRVLPSDSPAAMYSRVRGVDFEYLDRGDAPAPVGARDEPLRDDVAERLREPRADDLLLVLRVEADDAVDGLRRVDGVEGREDEVARLGRFERDLGRLVVAHLADEDDLRRLPERRAQRRGEVLGVRADLALVDGRVLVRVEELDGVFDGDDVVLLLLVDDGR